MSPVEIYNCIVNISLFGMLLWKRPNLPSLWMWQIASVAAIGAVAMTRHTPFFPNAFWLITVFLMPLEFLTCLQLSRRFSWINEIAVVLIVLHLIFESLEFYTWSDQPIFAWNMRHISVALNEIIGCYLILVVLKFPKEKYMKHEHDENEPKKPSTNPVKTLDTNPDPAPPPGGHNRPTDPGE